MTVSSFLLFFLPCLLSSDLTSSRACRDSYLFFDHDCPRPLHVFVKGQEVWDRREWAAHSGGGYPWGPHDQEQGQEQGQEPGALN